MKYLNKFLTLLMMLSLALLHAIHAQPGTLDANRMNRDINIMENILEEMFKVQARYGSGDPAIAEFGFLRSGQDVKGTYLPGYGVIFTIPAGPTPLIYHMNRDGDSGDETRSLSYSFAYRNGKNSDEKVDEEAVTRRIKEFLRDYGSTIGQLDPEEQVMVLYGHGRTQRQLIFMDSEAGRQQAPVPVLSVVAEKKDLDAFRAGKINEQQFDSRISVSKPDRNSESRYIDMEVMANIFETAFKENRDGSAFRIRGPVNHLKLDNFGALFFFDATYASSQPGVFRLSLAPKVHIEGDSDSDAESPSRARVEILRELDREIEEDQEKRAKKEKELEENVRSALTEFKTEIKEYMVDYGRTLRSVKSDQYVMASISISSRISEIPERLDLQVKKSVLEQLDSGSISREDALEQVMIIEY